MKNVFKFFTFIFISGLCFWYNQTTALADTFASELNKSCSQVCAENNQVCHDISTTNNNVNNAYCGFNESEECANISGDCFTIMQNTYLTCFDRVIQNEECGADLNKYLKWTNCNCVKNDDFSVLEFQGVYGQTDYMTGTSGEPVINSYQPFENYIFHDDNNHKAGTWTNIQAVLFSAMTAAPPVGADTHVQIFLKMALGQDNYTANCDGTYGVDWAWSPIGTATIPADGIFHDTAVFKDQNEDQCAYYNETYFCTICGIGIYTNPDEHLTWVKLGDADYPNFQLDIAGERVSNYSLWFLLAGTKNAEPASACDCASSSNIFFAGICEGFCYLFMPTDYGLTTFQTNYANLKSAFPFNTVYQLTDAISAATDLNNNATNTIDIPMVKKVAGHAQYYMQPVLSSSSMPNAIGGAAANIVRNSLSTLIWLITGGIAILLFIKF